MVGVGRLLELPPHFRADSGLLHETLDTVQAADLAALLQRGVDPRCTVGPATVLVLLADQHRQPQVLAGASRLSAPEPGVEAGAGDLQSRAHRPDLEDLPVAVDELEPQLRSFAK